MKRNCKSLFALFALSACLFLCGCHETSVPAQAPAETPAPSDMPSASRVISAEEAKTMIDRGGEFLLLDVRDRDEYETGHIPGSVCIPYTELEARREELPEAADTTILVYCRTGRRSAIAAGTLSGMGYSAVLDFGGLVNWPYEITGQDKDDTEECEHSWQTYDCSYERCEKCGRLRNYE